MIDHYEFGKIVIAGHPYERDVIVFADHVQDGWWRKEGHRLAVDDLQLIFEEHPDVLVVGTGYNGLMTVPSATQKAVAARGIQLIAQKTTEACRTFNDLLPSTKVVAALHLTC